MPAVKFCHIIIWCSNIFIFYCSWLVSCNSLFLIIKLKAMKVNVPINYFSVKLSSVKLSWNLCARIKLLAYLGSWRLCIIATIVWNGRALQVYSWASTYQEQRLKPAFSNVRSENLGSTLYLLLYLDITFCRPLYISTKHTWNLHILI